MRRGDSDFLPDVREQNWGARLCGDTGGYTSLLEKPSLRQHLFCASAKKGSKLEGGDVLGLHSAGI